MRTCRHGGALRGIAIPAGLLGLVLSAGVLEAQSADLPGWADSFAVVTPGPHYGKSGIWVAFAGHHYRELIAICRPSDTERPELKQARAFIGKP